MDNDLKESINYCKEKETEDDSELFTMCKDTLSNSASRVEENLKRMEVIQRRSSNDNNE
jgi:hypothetical protein